MQTLIFQVRLLEEKRNQMNALLQGSHGIRRMVFERFIDDIQAFVDSEIAAGSTQEKAIKTYIGGSVGIAYDNRKDALHGNTRPDQEDNL